MKKGQLRYQTFPKATECCLGVQNVVKCFLSCFDEIDSYMHDKKSDAVLAIVCRQLKQCGFCVETGKKSTEKISIPVLFGLNNQPEKSFLVDAYDEKEKIVVEIEAGQAVTNYKFLKDLFEACQMPQVEHLVIAVRNLYKNSDDFDKVYKFLETLYVNGRLVLPLKSVTIIGY